MAMPPERIPNYVTGHGAARVKETALFQDIFRDATIRTPVFGFAPKTNIPYKIIYPSNRGYSIVELIERPKDDVAKLNVWVVEGSTTIKASEYVKRRAGFPPVTPL